MYGGLPFSNPTFVHKVRDFPGFRIPAPNRLRSFASDGLPRGRCTSTEDPLVSYFQSIISTVVRSALSPDVHAFRARLSTSFGLRFILYDMATRLVCCKTSRNTIKIEERKKSRVVSENRFLLGWRQNLRNMSPGHEQYALHIRLLEHLSVLASSRLRDVGMRMKSACKNKLVHCAKYTRRRNFSSIL